MPPLTVDLATLLHKQTALWERLTSHRCGPASKVLLLPDRLEMDRRRRRHDVHGGLDASISLTCGRPGPICQKSPYITHKTLGTKMIRRHHDCRTNQQGQSLHHRGS
jgi:hypothetical protein